ncbi:MAG: DUF2851 family protein [Chlorobi bacterium]|nr:DUF2851 family protein [Chlorobiota bacterium]
MTEEFLHFLWGNRLCYQSGLKTADGTSFEIIHPGIINNDAGPDFFNAKIKIGNTLWAGNVEIHTRESDWYRHKHQNDPAYNNVILHVVQEKSKGTINSKGEKIPVWQMIYNEKFLYNYNDLLAKNSFIACKDQLHKISHFEFEQWLERILIEKIETKTSDIERYLSFSNGDWNEVFYITLARGFGFGVNNEPFEMLARSLPFRILLKHSDNILQLEALLLGQAGLLNNIKTPDEYTSALISEYKFLSQKYRLKRIESGTWRFLRLRPANFPSLRIAQFSMLIHKYNGRFDSLTNNPDLKQIEKMLQSGTSVYWKNHYRPGKKSKTTSDRLLGKNSIRLIMANSIIPYIFAFAKHKNNPELKEKALNMLSLLPPENNTITKKWSELSFRPIDEGQAQALIFLKNYYCNHKKCLYCHIGRKLIIKM